MTKEIIAIAAALILLVIGFLGVFVPLVPGVPLAWLGILIYALLTDFTGLSLTSVLVFLGLTILSMIVDFIAPLAGAKKYQASKFGIVGCSLGLLLGLFFGPLGIIFGPIAGAFLGELLAGKKTEQAVKSALGTFLGFLASAILKIIVILIMAGFFIASLF